MVGGRLPDRRNAIRAGRDGADRLESCDPAFDRPRSVSHQTAARPHGARYLPVVRANLSHHSVQPDAARERSGNQFLSAAFCHRCGGRVSQGTGRPGALGALIIGFLGVLLVTSPGVDTFQTGSLFALANAILFGTVTVGVRGMTATESPETLTMYQMVLLTAVFTMALPFGWITPSLSDSVAMVINGLGNALGQYLWTRALHLAPTSAVVPFNYFSLVWAIILGFLVWGDVPSAALLAGSAIVVGSGMFLLWHESRGR